MTDTWTLTATTTASARQLFEVTDGRANWSASECSAAYSSPQTGVGGELSWKTGDGETRVDFTTPVGGPEVFGRELSEEWRHLAAALELTWRIEGDQPDDAEDIAAAWRRANRQAVGRTPASFDVIDRDNREDAWAWNRHRQDTQQAVSADLFVPKVVFFADRAEEAPRAASRGIIWPDAIPMAAPEAELLVVSVPDSKQLSAPAGPRILPFDEALEIMSADERSQIRHRDAPRPHYLFAWDQAPYAVIEQLADAATSADESTWEGVSGANVVEDDLVEG